MSADVQAPELKVRFSRRDGNNGGEEEEVDIYDSLEQSAPDARPHEVSPLTDRRPAAVRRRAFGATAAVLGVLYLVILVGVYMRNVVVTLEKQNLQTERDELRVRLNRSETRNINVTEERDQLQTRYDTLIRNQTQDIIVTLQRERDQLRVRLNRSDTRNIKLTGERDQLQTRYDVIKKEFQKERKLNYGESLPDMCSQYSRSCGGPL